MPEAIVLGNPRDFLLYIRRVLNPQNGARVFFYKLCNIFLGPSFSLFGVFESKPQCVKVKLSCSLVFIIISPDIIRYFG